MCSRCEIDPSQELPHQSLRDRSIRGTASPMAARQTHHRNSYLYLSHLHGSLFSFAASWPLISRSTHGWLFPQQSWLRISYSTQGCLLLPQPSWLLMSSTALMAAYFHSTQGCSLMAAYFFHSTFSQHL